MVQTEKVWAAAEEPALPRLIAVNRLDRERASLDRTLASLRESCSRSVIPIQLPIGDEKAFRGVVDLVSKKAFVFKTDGSGAFTEAPVPAEMTAAVDAAREALIEMVAENDETLMEHFFEAGTLTDDELVAGLRSATIAGKLFPLVCTSALLNVGVPQLLDAIARLPAVAGRPAVSRHRQGRRRGGATGGREGPALGVRLEDDRRSVRRPHHHVPRRLRRGEGRLDRAQQDQGRARTARPPDADAGQDADERPRDQGRRSGRRREAEGHADQRRARRQERSGHLSRRRSSRSRCWPMRSSRRAAATRTRSAPRCTGSRKRTRRSATAAIRRPRNCCSTARDSCTSR